MNIFTSLDWYYNCNFCLLCHSHPWFLDRDKCQCDRCRSWAGNKLKSVTFKVTVLMIMMHNMGLPCFIIHLSSAHNKKKCMKKERLLRQSRLSVSQTQSTKVSLWQRAICWTFSAINMLAGVNMVVNYQGWPFSANSLLLTGQSVIVTPFSQPWEWWIVPFQIMSCVELFSTWVIVDERWLKPIFRMTLITGSLLLGPIK